MPDLEYNPSLDDLVNAREVPRVSNLEVNLKVVTLGDKSAGKTSLIMRFIEGRFKMNSQPTIGALFLCKRGTTEDGFGFKLQVWDTSGDKRFESMAPLYFKTADIILICYDVTSRTSFLKAHEWAEKIKQSLNKLNGENLNPPRLIVVGTKIDLHDHREVPKREAEAFAENNGALYYETSAKTGENVEGLFEGTTRSILQARRSAVLTAECKGLNYIKKVGSKDSIGGVSRSSSKSKGGVNKKGKENIGVCSWNTTIGACHGGADSNSCSIM
ncbi:hypothetical protein TrST_g9154 [Triparma strigata]|uniref:Uncharacterized protein n=1 Tax=Triparma strigata TaxID=1606541 RepID=A0A9W7C0B0_9STRA|nr:hypothetical protein TrST_g9154 [Triparma strigata]